MYCLGERLNLWPELRVLFFGLALFCHIFSLIFSSNLTDITGDLE